LDLDLVEVASEASPPVCRIMDFNRFKYEAAQRAKESKRKSTSAGIKEMKYRPKIGVGDFDTKTRQVARFLGEGHKVKVTIMFRGREMSHPDLGKKILDHVAEQVEGVGKVEAAPKLDGRNMIMVLAPERRPQVRKPLGAPGEALPEVSASQDEAGAALGVDPSASELELTSEVAVAPAADAVDANGAGVSDPAGAASTAAGTAAGAS
jgi:translation initiation factor IF-3